MIRLHHWPYSRSFRVLWLLEEMGLEAELVPYSIFDGSLRAPEFLGKSPGGRVPALEIDGRVLFESGAIVEYLCETRPEHGLGRPVGHDERPRFLECLHFAETQASILANLNLQHLFLRDPADVSPVLIKIDTARLRASLGALEALIGQQDYLLPSGFSGADTMLGFNLFAAPFFVDLAPFPAVSAYKARLEARPAHERVCAREGAQSFYDKPFYPVPQQEGAKA